MRILFLIACCWVGIGLAAYFTLPTWTLAIYGFLSLFYPATWLILRRGFVLVE